MKYTKIQKKLLLELVELTIKKVQYRNQHNTQFAMQVDLLILKKKREMEVEGIRFFDSAIRITDESIDGNMINEFVDEYLKTHEDDLLFIDKSHDFNKTKAFCFYTNRNSVSNVARFIEERFSTSKIEDEHIDNLSMDHWFVPEFLSDSSLSQLRDKLRG
ncbi:hypothetical protein R7Q39_22290 [Vibrio sp. 947]|uniref:hypothetical protein n=1 Tax=unclassified Vibrio TaxID=2614977 RepID=UPI002964E5EF|nr:MULTISPECIES: hypothetical protein [unclassified Vibrio]MDW1583543.1 hypothetical protein [Vibrio sp. Vb2897]MDW1641853.1 hypothetical protein [Vibrio sp. Vb2896]MDW1928136.1 hypothetical protein [Vibrio sp. 947]